MALDDLLAKLERNPALHDSGVTRVTGVTPSNGKGFAVTPTTCERVTGVTPGRADAGPVTPVTPTDDEGVTTKAAPILECTPVTPVTPQTDNGQGATARAWLLHFSDRDPMEVWTAPPATHDEILALYPESLAAEPLALIESEPPAATSCRSCRHRATPGRADPGYCAERTDQAKAYGEGHPLHRLPHDGGLNCSKWATYERDST